MSDSGMRKSAILLLAMGEERAAVVLRHMHSGEMEKLGRAMAGMAKVPKDELVALLEEFRMETEQLTALHLDSGSYFRTVLEKALGEGRSNHLLNEVLRPKENRAGIERLNHIESSEMVELIRDEHPQIIATLMAHLDRKKASEILEKLPERLRDDVILRIATSGGVQPAALKELTEVMTEMLSGESEPLSRLGGIRTAAEIVNLMTNEHEEKVMAHVRGHDETLAQRILDEMFIFDNLLGLEDRGIQRLLKELEGDTLIIALKGATDAVKEKFLKNMSSRAAEAFREDMELRGPVRVSEVEVAQKGILKIVRDLSAEGEITIAAPGSDDFV